MRAHYGYQDTAGDFFITIDTDRCNGCNDSNRIASTGGALFEDFAQVDEIAAIEAERLEKRQHIG